MPCMRLRPITTMTTSRHASRPTSATETWFRFDRSQKQRWRGASVWASLRSPYWANCAAGCGSQCTRPRVTERKWDTSQCAMRWACRNWWIDSIASKSPTTEWRRMCDWPKWQNVNVLLAKRVRCEGVYDSVPEYAKRIWSSRRLEAASYAGGKIKTWRSSATVAVPSSRCRTPGCFANCANSVGSARA